MIALAGSRVVAQSGSDVVAREGSYVVARAGSRAVAYNDVDATAWCRRRSDGYLICLVAGRVHAGCHHFTLSTARAHWSAATYRDPALGAETLAMERCQ